MDSVIHVCCPSWSLSCRSHKHLGLKIYNNPVSFKLLDLFSPHTPAWIFQTVAGKVYCFTGKVSHFLKNTQESWKWSMKSPWYYQWGGKNSGAINRSCGTVTNFTAIIDSRDSIFMTIPFLWLFECWGLMGRDRIHLIKWGNDFLPTSWSNQGDIYTEIERDEDDNAQSSKEMVDRVGKQMVPATVARRHLIINKTSAKGAHPKCRQTNKELLIELGKLSHFFWKISTLGCFSEVPIH